MKVEDLKGFWKGIYKEIENIGEIWGNGDENGRFEGFLERDL